MSLNKIRSSFFPAISIITNRRKEKMSKDIIEGEAERIKGKARTTAGKIIGSPKQRLKGDIEQAKGSAKKKVGKIKYRI